MKLTHIASALVTITLGLASFGAHAVVVNIDAQSAAGTTITLDAGTYTVSWIGTADGGAYNGWEASSGTGWREAYTVSANGGSVTFDLAGDGFYSNADALAALSAFETAGAGGIAIRGVAPTYYYGGVASSPKTFTIDSTTTFTYSVPDYYFADNTGGVSLSITAAVPEPETYALMLGGLGALAFVARRRKSNGV